jgi:putative sterol carrier protein
MADAPQFDDIDAVIDSYPDRFKPEEAEGTEGVVQLHLEGEDGGDYVLVIDHGTLEVREGVHDDPTMTVRTAASDWLALNNGAVGPMTLLMQGRITFSGSLPLALKFRSMFETYA